MLLRLAGFLAGAAGVSAELCAFLAARLNDGWAPVVPSRGISSAGEVVALSHLFATLAGAGEVREDGAVTGAAEALARRGVAPYTPALKEGLALVNGAPLAPALTAHLVARAGRLLEHATLAGALTATLCTASARPYSRRIGALKGDPGQERVHARLAALAAGAADWADRPQAPVSFRVLPQVHGAVLDQLDAAEAQLARELRAVTDSPLFLRGGRRRAGGLLSERQLPRAGAVPDAGHARDRLHAGRQPVREAPAPAARRALSRTCPTSSRPRRAGRPGSSSCTRR